MLEFLKAPFLVLHFSHYTLITFLMMLSVTLLSLLMILLSTFTCEQASDLWFWTWIWPTKHCVLGQELPCWFQCWKNWFCLTGLITLVLLTWKLMDLLLKKNHLLRCSSSLCLIDWSSYIISIAKTTFKKIEAFIRSMNFLSPENLYKYTIRPCIEYCFHVRLVLLVATWNY